MTIEDINGCFKFEMFANFFFLKNIVITFDIADSERIFSKINLLKRKAPCRLNTQSVNSLIALSECSPMKLH